MSYVYSQLLELLGKEPAPAVGGIFGTIAAISPLTVTVRGRALSRGLFVPRGSRFTEEDIGREVALLPCEEGFLVLFQVEGGGV